MTLPPTQPYLHFTRKCIKLPSAAIGRGDTHLGYLYTIPLRNYGSRPVRFKILKLQWHPDHDLVGDVSPPRSGEDFRPECKDSVTFQYGLPVFICVNRQGVVDVNEVNSFEFWFRPLEVQTYRVTCLMSISDATSLLSEDCCDTLTFEITIDGYDLRNADLGTQRSSNNLGVNLPAAYKPNQKSREESLDGELTHTTSNCAEIQGMSLHAPRLPPIKGVPLQLSDRLIDLGRVQMGSRTKRLVFLTNLATGEAGSVSEYRFNLVTRSPEAMQFLDLKPSHGVVKKKGSVPIEVIFNALSSPRFLEIDLIVEVFKVEEEKQFEIELKAWQSGLQCRKVEFTITEETLRTSRLTENDAKHRGGKLPNDGYTESAMSKPMAPKPVLLHLPILVQVNDLCGDCVSKTDLENGFIDSTLFGSPFAAMRSDNPQVDIKFQGQFILLADILTGLVSGLLEDKTCLEFIREVAEGEPAGPSVDRVEWKSIDDPVPLWSEVSGGGLDLSRSDAGDKDDVASGPKLAEECLPEKECPGKRQFSFKGEEAVMERETVGILYSSIPKESPTCQSVIEQTVTGVLSNLMVEACRGGIDLTTPARTIALPNALVKETH